MSVVNTLTYVLQLLADMDAQRSCPADDLWRKSEINNK